jgi:hypothetical protein
MLQPALCPNCGRELDLPQLGIDLPKPILQCPRCGQLLRNPALTPADGTSANVNTESDIASMLPAPVPLSQSERPRRSWDGYVALIVVCLLGIFIANAFALKSTGGKATDNYGVFYFPLGSAILFLVLGILLYRRLVKRQEPFDIVGRIVIAFCLLFLTGCAWLVFFFAVCATVWSA